MERERHVGLAAQPGIVGALVRLTLLVPALLLPVGCSDKCNVGGDSGVIVIVRDAKTDVRICDAKVTAIAVNGQRTEVFVAGRPDPTSCDYSGLGDRHDLTYDLHIERTGYEPAVVHGITTNSDVGCTPPRRDDIVVLLRGS